jgi:hypothetical protein
MYSVESALAHEMQALWGKSRRLASIALNSVSSTEAKRQLHSGSFLSFRRRRATTRGTPVTGRQGSRPAEHVAAFAGRCVARQEFAVSHHGLERGIDPGTIAMKIEVNAYGVHGTLYGVPGTPKCRGAGRWERILGNDWHQ